MFPHAERFDRWLRRRSPHAATPIHYTNDLKLFFAWAGKSPKAITLHDVDAYIDHCRDLGHAIATVNRRLAAIRTFYHFLQTESEDAPPNPVLPRRHFIRQGRRLPRDAKDADIERLFAAITSPRDRAIFLLMLRCGLRVDEVRKLSQDDLCLRPLRLRVCGKGNAQRVAYLSRQALAALQAWLAVRPGVEDRALFLNRFGRRLTVGGIQNRLAGYCRQAGVRITCHQLRHTFGRHLVEAYVPVTSIQQLLGHRWLRTTQLYLHLSNRQVQADYDAAMIQVARWLSPAEASHD